MEIVASQISISVANIEENGNNIKELEESMVSLKRLHARLQEVEAEHTFTKSNKHKQSHVLQLTKSLTTNLEIDHLFTDLLDKATSLVEADRGTLFLYDSEEKYLWSRVRTRI